MGGGYGAKGTNYGNTKGSKAGFKEALDHISNALAVASFIPGLDTVTNIASIPVDLLRGDYVSAVLDLVGVVPVFGEAADIAKTADKVSDTVKAIDKIADVSKTTKKASKITSVSDNAKSVAKKYNLGKNGYFGTKGKNTQVFKSKDPIKASADFYKKISKGGVERVLPNGKGVQTTFPDKSSVVYRIITKTPNSPAVEITFKTIGKIKPQKIHFIE